MFYVREQGARIIPARAGFTLLSAGAAQAAADHPRSRGVYTPRPPLVRRSPRIIPARAGFTLLGRRNALTPEDHPRSRGVYSLSRHMLHSTKGSSPLARGLPSSGCCSRPHDRIIPARAGFTIPSFGYPKLSPDHPRSRGVYCDWDDRSVLGHGSSPLARGLPPRRSGAERNVGIIPARAGFTRPMRSTDCASTDHPRSRGVYPRSSALPMTAAGSSPLARGLLGGR